MKRRLISFLLALAMVLSTAVWAPSDKVEAYSGEKVLALNDRWVSGQISVSGEVDYYKFVLAKPGYITVSFQVASLYDGYVGLYKADDSNYASINSQAEVFCEDVYYGYATDPKTWSGTYFVDAGVYFIKIWGYNADRIGDYKVKASYTAYTSNEYEPNDTFGNATVLNPNVTINGYAKNDNKDIDFFRIVVPYTQNVTFTVKTPNDVYFTLYDENNVKLDDRENIYTSDYSSPATETFTRGLSGGKYYIKIESYSRVSEYSITWSPTRTASTYSTSKVSVSGYRNLIVGQGCKVKGVATPNVSQNIIWKSYQPSIASITQNGVVYARTPGRVTFRAYAGDNTGAYKAFAIYVKPKMMGTPTVAQPKSGQIRVTYSKQTGVSGYQVNYQLSGSTKSATRTVDADAKSVIVSNLSKGKYYYVMVRSYVKCTDGTILYGSWSSKKLIKIK